MSKLEENKKIVFKPISATARKVGTLEGNDILNIEIPLEEDIQTINTIIKNQKSNDTKDKEDYIYKYNKNKGEDMDEDSVAKLFDDKMSKMRLNETIDKIRKITEDVDLRTKEIDKKIEQKIDKVDHLINDKIGSRFDLISDKFSEYSKKQEESCSGVECLKSDIGKLKGDHESAMSKIRETLDNVEKKLPKTAVCGGKDGCGNHIEVGSSYCPGCGREIETWGKALPGWIGHSKRKK